MQVLQPLPQGDSADLVVGQKVYAIGNPFGLDHSLTTGVISGMQREISSGINGRPIQGVVQIDAAINRAPSPICCFFHSGLSISLEHFAFAHPSHRRFLSCVVTCSALSATCKCLDDPQTSGGAGCVTAAAGNSGGPLLDSGGELIGDPASTSPPLSPSSMPF